jgi:AraC-like DNA-binding protein
MEHEYPARYLYKRIVQAKLFIDANYSERINLDNIADEAHFSRFHFIRLFKSAYGFTPHQYLTRVRITKAQLLLQEGIPSREVCFLVGFDSVSSFTGLFAKLSKCSPAAWQKQYIKRQEAIRNVPLQFIPNCFAEQKGWTQ